MSPGALPLRRALGSVKRQMLALAAVMLTIVLGASVVLVVTVVQSSDASANARAVSKARADTALAVSALLQQQNAVLAFVVTGDPAERAAVYDAAQAFTRAATDVRADLPGAADVDTLVVALQAAAARYAADVVGPATTAAAETDTAAARAVLTSPAATDAVAGVQTSSRAVWSRLDAEYRTAVTASVEVRSRLAALIVSVLAVLLLAVIAAVVIVRRSVVRPLFALQAAARRVATGAWDDSVAVPGPAEVVALASDVDGMRRSLLHALEGERRAAEALDQQGPAVLALRDALAPAPWTQPGFESQGRLDPVEGLLAGDWYDVVALGDHRAGLILGDVAGHGAASGVYALRLKGLLRQALRQGQSPGTALASVAAHVTEFPDNVRVASGELFATVFIGIVDREVDELVYASAGHLEAVVMRAVTPAGPLRTVPGPRITEDDVVPHASGLWDHLDLPPTGPMLSTLLSDRIWTERRHRFAAEDLLVVATDGVIEARDAGQTEYGLARIVDRIGARLVAGDGLGDAVDAVFTDVAGFERRARDDRTLVAVRQSSARRRFGATRIGSARPVRPS